MGAVPSSRDKICDVAEALFARRGYSGVGLREVAAEVGLGKSSLFHHFRSKAQLYCEVLDRALVRIAERLEPVVASPAAPEERLERWIEGVVDSLAEQPTTARLLLRALFEEEQFAEEPPPELARAEATLAQLISGLERLLAEGFERGVFLPVSVPHTVQSLIGASVYHFASAEVGESILGGPLFGAEAVADRRRELMRLFLHGLAGRPGPVNDAPREEDRWRS
jgi:AcrR family transcriptional regulator